MIGLIMKLIVCPLVVILSDALLDSVNYASIYQAIGVGIVLALLAHTMEVMVLRKGTFWISTAADFIAAFAVVYLSQFVLYGTFITFTGALITALLLTVTEYFQHSYLNKTEKTRKSE